MQNIVPCFYMTRRLHYQWHSSISQTRLSHVCSRCRHNVLHTGSMANLC